MKAFALDGRTIGEFLWGGVLSEAMACAIMARIARSPLLEPAERALYARFADEEAQHGRLLREAALQYTATAPSGSRRRLRVFTPNRLSDWEALALALAGERISARGFAHVEAFFRESGDRTAAAAYRQIAREEPAHIAASRALFRRAGPDVQASVRWVVAAALTAYREARR